MVLGRGFEPRSPALQAGAFTSLAFRARQRVHARLDVKMVRPARIELASSEWHSEALPIDQGRMVGNRGIEPRVPKAQVLQTRSVTRLGITRIWLQGSELNRLCLSASAYEADQRPVLVPASRVRGLNSIACRQYIRGQQNWRTAEVLIPNALQHPSRFERARGTRRVDCPSMAEDCELESHTREGASRFPSGAGAPARLVFHSGGWRRS